MATARSDRSSDAPSVAIIGGGGTGIALAYDLAQRGIHVDLFERGELTSGTTGRHHGQLHSGARYAVGDVEIARECMDEVRILQVIAPEALEMNYGLFLALSDDDVDYLPTFVDSCERAGIPTRSVPMDEAVAMEPGINPAAKAAVLVPDGTIDAWRLPLSFAASAQAAGARFHTYHRVEAIEVQNRRAVGVAVRDLTTGTSRSVAADVVVSAAGPWAAHVAALGGVHIDVTPAPGTMVAFKGRLNNMVVSHLHPPSDGDIVVPQRELSIIGSTQWRTDDPDGITVPAADLEHMRRRGAQLVPAIGTAEFHAAWAAARPLLGASSDDAEGRELSRDFGVVDHTSEGAQGFFSILGGKATVLRVMAEVAADDICRHLGVDVQCATRDSVLLSHRAFFNPRLNTTQGRFI